MICCTNGMNKCISTEQYKVAVQMCLIFKYLHCLKLCVYYYNKTSNRSCIYGYFIYKVCFTLLYTFLFHLIKLTFNDFVKIVLRVLKLELFGTKYNLLKRMFGGVLISMTQKLQPLHTRQIFFQSIPLLKRPKVFLIPCSSTPLEESRVPWEITTNISY
jgi:hypothetical protein